METDKHIQIKKASIKDLDTIYTIVKESSQWMKKEYGFTHWEEYYTKDMIKYNLEDKDVYILFVSDTPVGTYSMGYTPPSYYTKEDMSKFTNPTTPSYYGTTLSVLPKYHGNGYAKMMIAHFESLAKKNNVKYIRFDARGAYTELIHFYTKMGYTIVGEMYEEDDIYYFFEKEIQ